MHRILVAHDGSEHADRAAALVADMPWAMGSVVHLVAVVPEIHEIRRAWLPLALDEPDEVTRRGDRQRPGGTPARAIAWRRT